VAFADATDGVEPADERLALARSSAARLRGPRTLVDQFDGHSAQLLAQFFALGLEDFKRDACAPIQLIVELTPGPGGSGVPRRLATAMHASAIANRPRPGGSCGLELRKQGAAQIEVRLFAL